jgi:polyisoprenoid-binding protein YceI
MKLARRFLLALFAVALIIPAASAADHKLSGENTTLKFTGSKKDGKHSGQFPKLEGAIVMEGDDATKAKLTVTIDMTALTSDNPMLTGHLKNADFFEVKKYPEAKFESTKVEVTGDHEYKVTGDLTMHGKTAPITFPLKMSEKDGVRTLAGEWKLDRTKWGITYGKGMINDEVDMSVSIKLN